MAARRTESRIDAPGVFRLAPKRPFRRKRVLIVNAHFDKLRQGRARPFSMPQAVGPAYLAGAFDAKHCEIRLYNEQSSGPLVDERWFAWPDMLVLTGLTVAFDRMRQLTAYSRTKNPGAAVVAGGPAVRALPQYARKFFDYVCTGDIEQLRDVVRDVWGPAYMAEEMFPRFDLVTWFGRIAYVESSRNCNFRCAFCSLTGEGARYERYDLDYIRRQIIALGKRRLLIFVDNNFYGGKRRFFLDRLTLLKELWRAGYFNSWSALVTHDFFLKPENLDLVREAGCSGLFSGIESFDMPTLRGYNKRQNTKIPQLDLIRMCLEHGLMFTYGIIFDLTVRGVADCRAELDLITRTPQITLPAFVTQTIPLLGTPYFYDCLDAERLLSNTRLRDMDGSTLVTRPLDTVEDAVEFLRDLPGLRGYRRRILAHTVGFMRRYGGSLSRDQLLTALTGAGMLVVSSLGPDLGRRCSRARTFVTPSDALDPQYRPAFPVDVRYERYFIPTRVTDHRGAPAEELREDIDTMRYADREKARAVR